MKKAADKKIVTNEFAEFMLKQTPVFDELIMSTIRPDDGWEMVISVPQEQLWFLTRENVRRCVEGLAFQPSDEPKIPGPPIGSPADITMDRCRAVWPNVLKTRH